MFTGYGFTTFQREFHTAASNTSSTQSTRAIHLTQPTRSENRQSTSTSRIFGQSTLLVDVPRPEATNVVKATQVYVRDSRTVTLTTSPQDPVAETHRVVSNIVAGVSGFALLALCVFVAIRLIKLFRGSAENQKGYQRFALVFPLFPNVKIY